MDGLHAPGAPQSHGRQKMSKNAKRQQNLDGQKQAQSVIERMGQRSAVMPSQAYPGAVQNQQNPGHDAPGTVTNGNLQGAHGLSRNVLAYAFQHQDFKEHRADEKQSSKQVEQEDHGIGSHGVKAS